MKNGWYKVEQKVGMGEDFWLPDDEMVYVENGAVVVVKSEFTGNVREVNRTVTPELEKNIFSLEFDGLGVA